MPEAVEPRPVDVNGQSVRVRTSGLAWRQAGDEVVVLDLAASSYHAVNASGALLWAQLTGWTTAAELASVLASSFGLTPGQADRDVASSSPRPSAPGSWGRACGA